MSVGVNEVCLSGAWVPAQPGGDTCRQTGRGRALLGDLPLQGLPVPLSEASFSLVRGFSSGLPHPSTCRLCCTHLTGYEPPPLVSLSLDSPRPLQAGLAEPHGGNQGRSGLGKKGAQRRWSSPASAEGLHHEKWGPGVVGPRGRQATGFSPTCGSVSPHLSPHRPPPAASWSVGVGNQKAGLNLVSRCVLFQQQSVLTKNENFPGPGSLYFSQAQAIFISDAGPHTGSSHSCG